MCVIFSANEGRNTTFLPNHTPTKYRWLHNMAKNVLGNDLEPCSLSPRTGFYRDGCCNTGSQDVGLHIVCIEATEEFLEFSQARGNDLTTPNPMFDFPGLKPGDRWCLCVLRWKEALEAELAPPVILSATHISTLEFVELEDLEAHAVVD